MYLIFFIICILIVYILGYYRWPKTISLLQTSLIEFSFTMLLEKQPIVIEDKNTDLSKINNLLFKYAYSNSFTLQSNEIWHRNRYKYCLFRFEDDGEIYLLNPRAKIVNNIPNNDENIIAIQAKKGQIIILPFHWNYMIPFKNNNENVFTPNTLETIGIHDLITYFLP